MAAGVDCIVAEIQKRRRKIGADGVVSRPRHAGIYFVNGDDMGAGGKDVMRKPGRPRNPAPASRPMPLESSATATQPREILDALEVPPIDAQVRLTLQRQLYRSEKFGGGGRGDIMLQIRTITETEGNQNALVEPIISAVSMSMRPEWTGLGLKWTASFDKFPLTAIPQTMRASTCSARSQSGTTIPSSSATKLQSF
jgi:hypothetical protein